MKSSLVFLCLIVAVCCEPTIWFKEQFLDGWESRWIESKHNKDKQGKFEWSAGKFYNDETLDKGIQTSADAKFYGISSAFDSFSNEGKDLVIQFTIKHEQKIDCGGGYIKVYGSEVDQEDIFGDTPYQIMFGPDICGPGTKKVHVIFAYKGKNLLTKKDIKCKDDEYTHMYTLILRSDNTYEVKIDNEKVEDGKLEEDWDFLEPKKIKDPEAKKPSDWDDNEYVDDPDDTKPEDWDKPQYTADPEAIKPEDWDDEMDGEWEPPMVENPDYQGDWKPRRIKNPEYQGKWKHPEMDNPDYEADAALYKFVDIGAVGVDIWQVKSGTIFDNILITDDEDYAKEFGQQTWEITKEGEKEMKSASDEEARKKREEMQKEHAAEMDDEDDMFDDDFDEEDWDEELIDDMMHDEL